MQPGTPFLALARLGVFALLGALVAPQTMHAQDGTPEQRYWDWAELDFPPEEYQARRARLVEELRLLDGDGVLLIPSSQGTSHGPTFRQLDDFHYWTGLELPSSMLVVDARSGTSVVYAPARDPRFENPGRVNDFPGRPLADDPEIAAGTGLEIRDAAGLEARISELAASRTLRVNLGGPNAFAAVARVRAVKGPAEIAVIRRVARLTEDAIRRAAARVRPGAAVHSVADVEEILRDSIRGVWLTGVILGALASLVVALLAVGIYGTVSYRVATARREIGIRLALGARTGGVVGAVGGRLARVVGAALLVGAALAWVADRVLAAGGVPVGDADPRVLAAVGLLIALAAALACTPPLRRALRIDPARTLRSE